MIKVLKEFYDLKEGVLRGKSEKGLKRQKNDLLS